MKGNSVWFSTKGITKMLRSTGGREITHDYVKQDISYVNRNKENTEFPFMDEVSNNFIHRRDTII